MKSISLRELILAAIFAAVIVVLSQITIPAGLVPFTMQTFAVGLVATILGKKVGTISVFIYLLLGLIGLPVFAGFSSGFAVLFGPTGGFLVGFLANAFVTGWLCELKENNLPMAIIANLVGALLTLVFGTFWLQLAASMSFGAAAAAAFTPFIIPGIVKAVAAAFVGILVTRRLPVAARS
ncbi:biotin transporter BioY [Enterococcus sp. LJL120]